jgi:C4-dicarboxylate-specific signal transduction histidine kinase
MQEVLNTIINIRKYEYIIINNDFKVIEYSSDVFDYLNNVESIHQYDDVRKIVEEINGLEDIIEAISNSLMDSFKIPFVEKGENYINIIIHKGIEEKGINTVVILFEDITDYATREKSSFQDRNEKELLLSKIESQNRKLEEYNKHMQEIIDKKVDENRKKDQQLITQARLAAMGEMIAMIAHQWKQPLNIISLMVQNLSILSELGKLDDKELNKCVDESTHQIKYMAETITDFTNFFNKDKKKKEFFISESIKFIEKILGPILVKMDIALKIEINEDYKLFTYLNELNQVLLNIISNAKDALNEKEIENKEISVAVESQNDEVIISVLDNAGGIDEEILSKVFEPYFSTKKDKDGTGLGLYMSKIIIENNIKGQLLVSNEKDGAMFKIILKQG